MIDVGGDAAGSFRQQLEAVHRTLREELPGVRRVAAAVYDREADRLRSFLQVSAGETPFSFYEVSLADVPSLAAERRDRVIDDLEVLRRGARMHSRRQLECGYRSSYTRPFFERGRLRGFAFFDADVPGFFTAERVRHLAVYSRLVSLLVLNAFGPANLLRSAVEVAREMSADRRGGGRLRRPQQHSGLQGGVDQRGCLRLSRAAGGAGFRPRLRPGADRGARRGGGHPAPVQRRARSAFCAGAGKVTAGAGRGMGGNRSCSV